MAPKLDPDKTVVSDVMTKNYVSIDENYTLEETLRLMTKNRVDTCRFSQNLTNGDGFHW